VQRKRFFYLPVGLNTPQDEPPLWDVESYDGDAHRTAISGSQMISPQIIIPELCTRSVSLCTLQLPVDFKVL
jgi:hypothetical protein